LALLKAEISQALILIPEIFSMFPHLNAPLLFKTIQVILSIGASLARFSHLVLLKTRIDRGSFLSSMLEIVTGSMSVSFHNLTLIRVE
jgi:hypothetical protein